MADLKDTHYRTQVHAALLAGQWTSPAPAKTPNGSPLSWSELFRKAKKHSKHADVPEAASQTHFLSLLLASTNPPSKELGNEEDPFALGHECVLLEERREDAQKAYELLQQLSSSDEFVKQAMAFFAFALDRPSECLEHVAGVAFADALPLTCPTLLVTPADEKAEKVSIPSVPAAPVDVEDGSAWLFMEALRSACLKGMAQERTAPDSPSKALASYDKGLSLLRTFAIPKALPAQPGRTSFESFTKYRELWRWAECLLWRSIVLSAQHWPAEKTLSVFRTYAAHSVHWPPTFQPAHRSTVCALYLRALVKLRPAAWSAEMRSVVLEYRAILSASTRFPSAGERNTPVEEFVDLCVAAWEAGGSVGDQSSWVLDILWWATRLTFNSPRILRHMARLLHVSGDHTLAVRVVRLYVQVVQKARETGALDAQGEDTHDEGMTERDTLWVDTLVQGARMLCRVPYGGVREAREADALVARVRDRLGNVNDELVASVDLADGICKFVLAIRGQEPGERGALLSKSVDLLLRSVERNPTPSACFHAALALSQPIPERNLERAIELCRRAVEAEPREVRHWHLLALLEAKLGEWKKAKGVLEAAIEVSEDVELRTHADELREDGIVPRDFGYGHEDGDQTPTASAKDAKKDANGSADPSPTLVDSAARCLPPAADLLLRVPDHPRATPRELFDHALQLRMTQIALTERVEGAEGVEACWLEVFEWYSQRRDTFAQARSGRPSIDTRLTPSPAFFDTDPNDSSQVHGDMADGSSALPISNAPSHAPSSSLDATTIRSPARSSLDRPAEASDTIGPGSSVPTSVHRSSKEKRRMSGESTGSPDRDKKGKRVQQMLKNQVHKHQARINTISKKIGNGVARSSLSLHRSVSAPDLHAVLVRAGPYQASSIHSRRRISFSSRSRFSEKVRGGSPAAPSSPLPPLPTSATESSHDNRNARERRLLSDLWLMSAATFRRLEKLDQTRGAIQEAETLDEENEAVWVQLGLYFSTLGEEGNAIEAFHKALFIAPDDVPATVHLCGLYLRSRAPGAVDLAAGMLEALTRGAGWDGAEAWYLLARACRLQGRSNRERECLLFALGLAEVRGVRDVGVAVGWCL